MSKIPSMMTTLRLGALLCGGLSLSLGLAGCGAAAEADSDAAAPATARLASLRLQGGARVEFLEPEAGRVIVVADAALPQLDRKIAPAALYEQLSGQAAPAALRDAEARSIARQRARTLGPVAPDQTLEPASDLRRDLPGGVASTAQGLSAADFSASYCPSGSFGFYFCMTNRTGDGSHDISSVDWLRAYANAYRGQVQLKLSYRNMWGNWINIYNQTVPEDTVKTVYTSDNDRYLTEVTQASGDGYHWSVYGDK